MKRRTWKAWAVVGTTVAGHLFKDGPLAVYRIPGKVPAFMLRDPELHLARIELREVPAPKRRKKR